MQLSHSNTFLWITQAIAGKPIAELSPYPNLHSGSRQTGKNPDGH